MKTPSLAEKLGGAIRQRRVASGLSQEAFADKIEMHRTYYSAIERGEKNLQLDTLERVAAGLDALLWEMFREAEAKK